LIRSIPVAVVGLISNINFLTEKIPFLSFIDSIPEVILGVVTGLLPVIMLAVLMALLPIWLRFLAKKAGLPTLSQIELRVQTSYFWFQVCGFCH
jgi:calcium permeable stress-gated cation channel